MRISIDTNALDYSFSLSDQSLTIAQRDGSAVAVAPSELGNLLERLRLAARLYELAPSLCGPLRADGNGVARVTEPVGTRVVAAQPVVAEAPAPSEPVAPPSDAQPAHPTQPTRKLAAVASPEPERPAARDDRKHAPEARDEAAASLEQAEGPARSEPAASTKPALPTPVVEEASEDAVTWRVQPTVLRRRRLGEPEPRETPPPRETLQSREPARQRPLQARPATARPAGPAPSALDEDDGSEKESKSKRRRRRRKLLEAARAAAKPAAPWQSARGRRTAYEQRHGLGGDKRAPAPERTHTPRVAWKPGAATVSHLRGPSSPSMVPAVAARAPQPPPVVQVEEPKPQRVIPPLPKTAGQPQLTDVMVHFLKHNGPSSLDDAVRYVRNQRIMPAAMNLRLSLIIALSKESFGFVRLDDGRYALKGDAG